MRLILESIWTVYTNRFTKTFNYMRRFIIALYGVAIILLLTAICFFIYISIPEPLNPSQFVSSIDRRDLDVYILLDKNKEPSEDIKNYLFCVESNQEEQLPEHRTWCFKINYDNCTLAEIQPDNVSSNNGYVCSVKLNNKLPKNITKYDVFIGYYGFKLGQTFITIK